MIRILQVIDNMNIGGMELMLMNYYRNINRNIIQYDFLIFNKNKCYFEDEINKMGGKVYHITSRRENFLKNRIELRNFFKKYKYQIVEFQQGITYYYPLKVAKKSGVKARIIHNHGIDATFLKKYKLYNEIWAKKRICGLANYYFTCSTEVQQNLFTNSVINSGNIHLIYNAIDVKKYKYSEIKRNKIRKEFNLNFDTTLYGHVGNFTYPKNHLFLLDVFYELLKINPKSKLLLAGDGENRKNIENKIKTLGISDKVILAGNRNDIDCILSGIDALIFPSLWEGLPLSLIEAQISGLPIFISNNINEKSMINNNGLIIDLAKSPKEWASNIYNYSIIKDRTIGYKNIQNSSFDISHEAKKIEKIYLKIYNELK